LFMISFFMASPPLNSRYYSTEHYSCRHQKNQPV
jgi:hypothetical protein